MLQPDRKITSFKGRQLAQKEFPGYTLEVIYKQEEERIVILTAYWL